jgi:hypothetical protein
MTTRTHKNQPGDWVAVPAPAAPGGVKPGKVTAFGDTTETVRVEVRGWGVREYPAPLPRIRWERRRGRSMFKVLG